MTVFGICMVRDADDIIGPVVQHMMGQVDHVIVADNLSVDGTRHILDSFNGNITVVEDNDPAYKQSEKMTRLAMVARKAGADFVVPFDADEWWSAREGTLKDVIEGADADINVAWVYDYIPTGVDWDTIANPIQRIRWRRKNRTPLHKVACRTSKTLTIHMGNHNASYKNDASYSDCGEIIVRHFPIRSAQQMINKSRTGAKALALTDLSYESGQHWRDWNRLTDDELREVWKKYWFEPDPYNNPDLIYDPVIE